MHTAVNLLSEAVLALPLLGLEVVVISGGDGKVEKKVKEDKMEKGNVKKD